MEKNIIIPLPGKKRLYGKFEGSLKQPLFIIIHGLPGNMDEQFYYSATKYFKAHGYATYRFNLYDWQTGARQLMDCTLRIQADDLDRVVKYFRKKGVKKIFVAGHSFAGPTILLSKDQAFDAAALWDPSYDIAFTKKKYGIAPYASYVKALDAYLMAWGVNVILGKAMVKETESLQWNVLARDFKVPFKVIVAGKGVLVKRAEHYVTSAKAAKAELAIIPGASHYFNDKEGMQGRVYKVSNEWFKKFF